MLGGHAMKSRRETIMNGYHWANENKIVLIDLRKSTEKTLIIKKFAFITREHCCLFIQDASLQINLASLANLESFTDMRLFKTDNNFQ